MVFKIHINENITSVVRVCMYPLAVGPGKFFCTRRLHLQIEAFIIFTTRWYLFSNFLYQSFELLHIYSKIFRQQEGTSYLEVSE